MFKTILQKIFSAIKNILTIKKFLVAFVVLWILFSIAYIVRDQWLKFRINMFQAGYQQGINDSIKTIMERAKTCQPVTLFEGDKEEKIISLDCLQKPQQ